MIFQLLRRMLSEHLSLAIIGIVAGSFVLLSLFESSFVNLVSDWHFDDITVGSTNPVNAYFLNFSHSFSSVIKIIAVVGFMWAMVVQLNYLIMTKMLRFAVGVGFTVLGFYLVLTLVTPNINRLEEKVFGKGPVLNLVYQGEYAKAIIESNNPQMDSLQAAYLVAQIELFRYLAERSELNQQSYEASLNILDAQIGSGVAALDPDILVNLYRNNKFQSLNNLAAKVETQRKLEWYKIIGLILCYGFGIYHLYIHRKYV